VNAKLTGRVLILLLALTPCITRADNEAGLAASQFTPQLSKERIRELLVPDVPGSAETYFRRHAEGWWWYKDPALEEDDLEKGKPDDVVKYLDAAKTVEETREIFQAALNTALMNPTRFNVKRYMYAKEWFMERAEVFTNVVQRVRWQSPDLDYSLVRPVNSTALNVYKQTREQENRENASSLGERGAGLFFFMSSTCPYCTAMAPTLQSIQQDYGMPVMAITMDGGGLPEFPHPKMDNGISESLGVYTVPAVYLVMPESGDVLLIGTGMMSRNEVLERVFSLSNRQLGESR